MRKDYEFEYATFGMGNFWYAQKFFDNIHGIISTKVGFSGGISKKPNSKDSGDHTQVIYIEFNSNVISYEVLLDYFWKNHDYTRDNERKYMSVIFYHDLAQQLSAKRSLEIIKNNSRKPVMTRLLPFDKFYEAEKFNQDYFRSLDKNTKI